MTRFAAGSWRNHAGGGPAFSRFAGPHFAVALLAAAELGELSGSRRSVTGHSAAASIGALRLSISGARHLEPDVKSCWLAGDLLHDSWPMADARLRHASIVHADQAETLDTYVRGIHQYLLGLVDLLVREGLLTQSELDSLPPVPEYTPIPDNLFQAEWADRIP